MASFTCLACRVGFASSEAQRVHYKTDWHRYNLKRKIAGMVPVSAANFQERVTTQQEKDKEAQRVQDEKDAKKAGKKGVAAAVAAAAAAAEAPGAAQGAEQEEEEEEEVEVEPLTIETCIFCTHVAANFEENLLHMTSAHSFFVPDIEFIDNLEGLIQFLQAKVWENCVCLLCNGRGRGFASGEAVRKHMRDKGHCMINYSEEGRDEIAEFFDFSTSYPDWEDVDSGDEDKELNPSDFHGARISETGYELVLSSGIRVGHRALARYYKQRFRVEDSRDSVMTAKVMHSRRAIGGPAVMDPQVRRERRERDAHVVRSQYMRQNIAMKQNMLMFYFRQQIDV